MADLHATKPCRLCLHGPACANYLRELRELVADHTANSRVPLPDVVIDCAYFQAKRRQRA